MHKIYSILNGFQSFLFVAESSESLNESNVFGFALGDLVYCHHGCVYGDGRSYGDGEGNGEGEEHWENTYPLFILEKDA